jgi:glycogen phosphorylase
MTQVTATHAVPNWPDVEGMDELIELALNLRWSWNHGSDWIWKSLDSELWESTQNPWIILRTVSRDELASRLGNPEFRKILHECLSQNQRTFREPGWFQKKHSGSGLFQVAYFSMEFMLSEALPIYSGGLGNVAGDQMKAASNLGVPVTGVGLLYGQGYFRQDFDMNGNQQALYPVNDPGQLPMRPLREPNGEWLRIKMDLAGANLWLRCWQVEVGRTKLYLLDSNDFSNNAAQRCITSQLYGGDAELRLKQEIVLGIGGWRLLRAIGLQPEVCHLNEGHAAFAILERARSYMKDHNVAFELALAATRPGNLFTTHTAVAAGFDRFDSRLLGEYLENYAEQELRIPFEQLLAMGTQNAGEPFNMAYLAVRGSGRINGVSKLHGQVSRHIFQPLFPRWPEDEVPIGSVTNGIHTPTWDSEEADALWTHACGKGRWMEDGPQAEDIRCLTDEQLWQMRTMARKRLIDWVRKRSDGDHVLDQNVLTVGFARRFATYKRPDFLLRDPERFLRLLTNPKRPMQLVLAGKAHPQDQPGQALAKKWNDFIRRREVRQRVVFLSDYDMLMAQQLVQGADLWINTPRRPWEACGTSGMKVLVNGGLNFSELDGWWAEAYSPQVGWAIGDGKDHGDDPNVDLIEAEAMYTLLEQQVIPEFYDRSSNGMPAKWLARVRESMARLTPEFSASRTIRDYTEDHYLPAATGYSQRSAGKGALAAEVVAWQQKVAQHFATVRFGSLHVDTRGDEYWFTVKVSPGKLLTSDFKVELYTVPTAVQAMTLVEKSADPDGMVTYSGRAAATRPWMDYTPRIVPYHPAVAVPLEANQILWQR